jgi:hypothetical protein
MGVETVEIHGDFTAELETPSSIAGAQRLFANDVATLGLFDLSDSASWTRVFVELTRGTRCAIVEHPRLDGPAFAIGTAVDEIRNTLTEPEPTVTELGALPRIGVYAPWSGSMNEGWLRSMLDRLAIPYTRVRPESVRAGRLDELLDVLVLPSLSATELRNGRAAGTVPDLYTRGLGDEGVAALDAFVKGGGRVVALESSADALIEMLGLPLTELTSQKEAETFSCPGSVLRTRARVAGWDAPAVMFAGSRAYAVRTTDDGARAEILVEYAPRELLLSGWIRRPETIAGQGWLVRTELGAGRVDVFATQPQYRGWTDHALLVLLRTLIQ